MKNQNIRFFLLAGLILIGMMLYQAWQTDHARLPHKQKVNIENTNTPATADNKAANNEIPTIQETKDATYNPVVQDTIVPADRLVTVKTDVFDLTIDTMGGDIIRLALPQYSDTRSGQKKEHILFDHTENRYYIAQSGLASTKGPDIPGKGRMIFTSDNKRVEMSPDQTELNIDLSLQLPDGIHVIKHFNFQRGSYQIGVGYTVKNNSADPYKGSLYARLKRHGKVESSGGFMGMGAQTFTGAAIHTPDSVYKKYTFKEMAEKPVETTLQGGFAAMDEHYFVSAWVPSNEATCTYQVGKLNDDIYSVGFVVNPIEVQPKENKQINIQLYAGPEIAELLAKAAPGLEHSVDYGMLWPICRPLFWLLKKLYQLTGNWGVAIILITVIIKLLFYKLSATSYRSMGNMRRLQPRIESLKERFGDDKPKFSQAVMELYKKEKVNPLGGCLPILVQIPVFIALYYVLLGSIELRLAPFMLWITDLSDKDPYYVLPILMGISMFVQQKMSPAPPDPMQAKVMMMMPIIFTVLFLSFPSGLVLYWLVNNCLSILQQWIITRQLEKTTLPKAHGVK